MPAYDYRCDSCGTVFEKTQRITEPAGAECPKCASGQCTRLITGGTFHLKGSGWYASDYGAKKPPVEAGKKPGAEKNVDGAEKKADAGNSESASEAKTADAPAAAKPAAAPAPTEGK